MEKISDYLSALHAMDAFQSGGTEPCLDLSKLSEQELLLLIAKYPKSTCPIVHGLSPDQRTQLPRLMSALTKSNL